MSATALAEAAASVQASTLALLRRERPALCAAYAPIGSEPGGADLPEVLSTVTPLLLPRLLPDNSLAWTRFRGTLTAGPRGLREPDGPATGDLRDATLIIVPAVAVSRSGVRLGRGGGSYDRALATAAPTALTVALLHDGELVDDVPTEPHDQRVHAVITPTDGFVSVMTTGSAKTSHRPRDRRR